MAPAVVCTDPPVGVFDDYNGVGLCQDAHTIELTLDGVPYELQAYRIDEEQFAAEWRCKDCDETDGVLIRAGSLDDALDFARFSLVAHHQFAHPGIPDTFAVQNNQSKLHTIRSLIGSLKDKRKAASD